MRIWIAVVGFCLLAGCAREKKDEAVPYQSPHVELHEVSESGCLNLNLLYERLAATDPSVTAHAFTYDIKVRTSEESCPGAAARLVKGNFHRVWHSLKESFRPYRSIAQTGCQQIELLDVDGQARVLQVESRSPRELQANSADGFGLGVQWVDPEMMIIHRRFPALNLRRPRLSNLNLNPQFVEVVEVVHWDPSSLDQNQPLTIATNTLQVLLESTEQFPLEIATALAQTSTPELRVSAETFSRIETQGLRPDLEICEPFIDKTTQVERSAEI